MQQIAAAGKNQHSAPFFFIFLFHEEEGPPLLRLSPPLNSPTKQGNLLRKYKNFKIIKISKKNENFYQKILEQLFFQEKTFLEKKNLSERKKKWIERKKNEINRDKPVLGKWDLDYTPLFLSSFCYFYQT